MKSHIFLLLVLSLLCTNLSTFSQSAAPIGFDIRGRDCAGGLGLCSASKTNGPNNDITVLKTGEKTFVLTILRNSLTKDEEESIAGKPFSSFQTNLPSTFTQSGDLLFDDQVVQTLGIAPKYNLLKKGNYPMTIDGNVVKITLTLEEGAKN